MADTWQAMLAPDNFETVMTLAREAGELAAAVQHRLGIAGGGEGSGAAGVDASTAELAEALSAFHFPDDHWARIIYDLVVATRPLDAPVERFVAALVPIYFGRVGSFIIENRHVTTDQAEERVERQAREFELLKPYLVDRWEAAGKPTAGTTSPASGKAAATPNGKVAADGKPTPNGKTARATGGRAR
jgi:hypothetical protein